MTSFLSKKKEETKTRTNISAWVIFAVSVFSTLAVTHGDTTLVTGIIHNRIIPIIRYLLVLIVLVFTTWNMPSQNKGLKALWMVIWFFFTNIYTYAGSDISSWISGICNFIFLFSIFCTKRENLIKAVSLFRYYLVFTSVLGIIAFSDFLTGGHLPHVIIDYYDYENIYYANYYFSYFSIKGDGIRLCGLFNEPGYFGTFIALYLIMDEIRLKKMGNVFLLVAGILTFSMAFFIILGLGVLFFIIKNKHYGIIVFVSISFLTAPFFKNIQFENESAKVLYERVVNIVDGTETLMDRRTDANFEQIERRFEEDNHKLFGYGTGYCSKKGAYDTSSYKRNVVEWGYLGFGLVFLVLLYLVSTETKLNGTISFFILCISISVSQRPQIFIPAYFLLYFGGINYLVAQKMTGK
jgi:hypothetical protein